MIDILDRRILGAFICTDAFTGISVVPAVPATAPQWTVRPNHSGVYVIFNGPGLDQQSSDFIPVGNWPPSRQFEVALQDPTRRYLPRRAIVKAPLPIPAIPPVLSTPTGVFEPQKVALYPSPAAPVNPNWAVIHASVTRAGVTPTQPLSWTVLQVVRDSDHMVLATGQTGPNGEALLAVIGLTVQANSSGGGPVTVSTVAATITAYCDPSTLNPPDGWIPNPDDILGNLSNPALKSASQPIKLSAGQELSMSFSIPV
jgi:hypothetical protein